MDLDTDQAAALDPMTHGGAPPEGVHAVIWLHGVPVAEMTVAGPPEQLLAVLPELARRDTTAAIRDHLAQHAVANDVPLDERTPCTEEEQWRARVDGALLTVAVCTRDRPDDLERCLVAIDDLTVDVAEVLVVDNASATDRTREVVERHPAARYVLEPRRGTAWARNRVLMEARTPLVAYVDDDVLVHPRWAEALLMAFVAHPGATAVTGLVTPAELATPAQVVFEAAGGFGRGFRQRRLQAESTEPRAAARAVYHIGAMGTGANMAFRRERLAALGGFDPALGPGTPTAGGEDHEALCRLLTSGDLIVYEPAAVVRHRHRRTMSELRGQRRADGAGSASLLVGAGHKLGAAHHRQWIRLAVQWLTKSAAWTLAASVIRPAARPMSLTLANIGGWAAALTGGHYRKALAQARQEARDHPDEPLLTPLTEPAADIAVHGRDTS